MSGRHKFDDLIAQLPPERRQEIARRTAEILATIPPPQTEGAGNLAQATGRSRQPRDTYRYHYKVGNKIVFTGITNNPARREAEHQRAYPGGRIDRIAPRVTRKSAERWEQQQRGEGRPTQGYR